MFIILFCLILILPLGAAEFGFNHNTGEKYHISSLVREMVIINDQPSHTSEILNKISVHVTDGDSYGGELDVVFEVSETGEGNVDIFQWSGSEKQSFYRSSDGTYDVPEKALYPSVRNVPSFPDYNLEPGDSWNMPGEEVHDLSMPFRISEKITIPFRAYYTYRGKEEREGVLLDVFDIEYRIFYRPIPPDDIMTVYPVKLYGKFDQTMYWNSEWGKPAFAEEEFYYAYTLSDGNVWEFQGVSEGKTEIAEVMDKPELKDEIDKTMSDSGLDGEVIEESDGLVLRFDNILFKPNLAEFRQGEGVKLEKLSDLLKAYPNRDILIMGHTARWGSEEACQILSENRANAVAEYLLQNGTRERSQLFTRGYGSREPVADNSTEEGMSRNRRVEIKLLEN